MLSYYFLYLALKVFENIPFLCVLLFSVLASSMLNIFKNKSQIQVAGCLFYLLSMQLSWYYLVEIYKTCLEFSILVGFPAEAFYSKSAYCFQ